MKSTSRNKWWFFTGTTGAFFITTAKTLLSFLKVGTIGGTVISMLLSIGTYALVAPMHLVVGVIILVLIHELGHVWAARRKGVPTSAPVFIPLIGAMVNMKKHPTNARTEAYIAIWGPIWGTIAAVIALIVGWVTEQQVYFVMAYVGFILNLINLLPIKPLDGGKIAIAVSRWLWLAGLIIALGVIVYYEFYLLLLIWCWFAWDIYRKYRIRKGKLETYSLGASFEVPAIDPIDQPWQAYEGGELPFTTYSDFAGKQRVILLWEEVGMRGVLTMSEQSLIRQVRIFKVDKRKRDGDRIMVIRCRVTYDLYVNDAYYEVPKRSRWKFGFGYVSLVCFLLLMIYVVSRYNLMVPA